MTFYTLTPKICLALSSTSASRYYNCCIDGSTSPGNYIYIMSNLRNGHLEMQNKTVLGRTIPSNILGLVLLYINEYIIGTINITVDGSCFCLQSSWRNAAVSVSAVSTILIYTGWL
jgi:hypothetical protein